MRTKIIAGNWKMNKTNAEAAAFASDLKTKIASIQKTEMVVCPPFTALTIVAEKLQGSRVKVGAQNLFWESSGAFTGEISTEMLESAGCHYVIIGHSERRQYFGETNQSVNKKIKQTLRSRLIPICCIGETLQQRQNNQTEPVVRTQIIEGLEGITAEQVQRMVIAYEPVWAIGTGVTATPEQAEEVHHFIRELLRMQYNDQTAATVPVLYGGSVKPDNIRELISKPNIDGALIGGASLNVDGFVQMIKVSEQLFG
ncbi:MAG: triose-phosphate isomerase [candidate division KSB1 bacterium]|nr:triose-phosphate isomerase [candidate division KSB1 bacterium]MDZ7317667.1 triose-phosphate isomerase [candidate division KSB1 bacterium]MDZ7341539.1 triose-phosphate isomerase [candidate division KSB1 bacterium]